MSADKRAVVIIASKAGRLGNRLFQSAHFMGNALTRGYCLLNPSLGEYAPFFIGSMNDPLCAFPNPWRKTNSDFAEQCRESLYNGAHLLGLAASLGMIPGLKAIDIRKHDEMEELGINLGGSVFGDLLESKKLILTMGWKFYDHESLIRHREVITSYFTPVESITIQAKKIVDRAREMGDFVIGVHVRQEDYRFWKGGVHYYETFSYVKWMKQCLEIFGCRNPSFLICSSNPLEEKLFQGFNIVQGPGSVVGDMHSLSLCDAIMGPPSTFSSWAAYYGKVPMCFLESKDQRLVPECFTAHF